MSFVRGTKIGDPVITKGSGRAAPAGNPAPPLTAQAEGGGDRTAARKAEMDYFARGKAAAREAKRRERKGVAWSTGLKPPPLLAVSPNCEQGKHGFCRGLAADGSPCVCRGCGHAPAE